MSNSDIIEGLAGSNTKTRIRISKHGWETKGLVWRAGLFSANAYRQVKSTGVFYFGSYCRITDAGLCYPST